MAEPVSPPPPTHLNLQSFPMGNLRFLPSLEDFENHESWSNRVQSSFAEAAGLVERILPLLHFPIVSFVAPVLEETFRKENGIPAWADAFSRGNEIFICSALPPESLTPVLAHELFHFAVSDHSDSRNCLPDWFNEALAYLIQDDNGIEHQAMRTYLKYDSSLVISLMLEDRILEESTYGTALAKAFGRFLKGRYSLSLISELVLGTIYRGDFHESAVLLLGQSPRELIEAWLSHLAWEQNLYFYEEPVRYVG